MKKKKSNIDKGKLIKYTLFIKNFINFYLKSIKGEI